MSRAVSEQENLTEEARQDAAIVGEFWSALKAYSIPDEIAGAILIDWHAAAIWADAEDGV